MTNPFEDENGRCRVLTNDEPQYSLWPAFADIPADWSAVVEDGIRQECFDYIEKTWTGMRPRSLIEKMAEVDVTERARTAGSADEASGEPVRRPR